MDAGSLGWLSFAPASSSFSPVASLLLSITQVRPLRHRLRHHPHHRLRHRHRHRHRHRRRHRHRHRHRHRFDIIIYHEQK